MRFCPPMFLAMSPLRHVFDTLFLQYEWRDLLLNALFFAYTKKVIEDEHKDHRQSANRAAQSCGNDFRWTVRVRSRRLEGVGFAECVICLRSPVKYGPRLKSGVPVRVPSRCPSKPIVGWLFPVGFQKTSCEAQTIVELVYSYYSSNQFIVTDLSRAESPQFSEKAAYLIYAK